jgi:hypothetical protein
VAVEVLVLVKMQGTLAQVVLAVAVLVNIRQTA